jgi:hypothetical protein
MALVATIQTNPVTGLDAVAYDLVNAAAEATSTVTITPALTFVPEYAFVQDTTAAGVVAGRQWAAIITTGSPVTVVISTASTAATACAARVQIGRWPRPQNRS